MDDNGSKLHRFDGLEAMFVDLPSLSAYSTKLSSSY